MHHPALASPQWLTANSRLTLPLGVTGNTPDSGSGESWFDPRRGNSKREATMSRVALRPLPTAFSWGSGESCSMRRIELKVPHDVPGAPAPAAHEDFASVSPDRSG